MQSELWTPRIFRGVLDGQNHKLYNFVTDPASPQTGFVSDLGGTVKNLVLGSSDGSTYDGTSLVSHASDSTFWCNVASVAARLGNNGKIMHSLIQESLSGSNLCRVNNSCSSLGLCSFSLSLVVWLFSFVVGFAGKED